MQRVIVITGATGTGKTTVSQYLRDRYQVPRIITHTTRPKRPGERDRVDYYFETKESFSRNHFLESVTYSGYQYGSSYEGLERAFQTAPIVSIVLDTKGALTYVRELGDQALVLFLTVSQTGVLKDRIERRGDQLAMIEARIQSDEYRRDLQLPTELDGAATVIQNDDWEQTKGRLDSLMADLTRVKEG
ncbi:guanylate kinase [Secundilactobacillus kimchicus]|uniref:guanylate kinase n=1 Tax=Secundilactobacillus kimchicus TaxID=528209 RepID=UPI001C02966F|nr:guanylate kinase [Secundilactobacillus kimchicus]MBT9671983.1 guanylate kinase [Secundilactobacillus kimchicus]